MPDDADTGVGTINNPSDRRAGWRALAGFFVVLVAVPSLAGFAGRLEWHLDLLNHFRFHYALFFAATTAVLVLLRGRKTLLISAALLAVNAWPVAPLYLPAKPAGGGGPELHILQFNVNTQAGDPARVADYLRQSDADLVFLQEISQRWLDALDGNTGPYRLVTAEPREDNFGIACYVRSDRGRVVIDSAELIDLTAGLAGVAAIDLRARVADQPVSILSMHTLPPVSRRYAAARDAQLDAAGQWAGQQAGPCVLIGDLNATPWSCAFRDLVAETGLHDSQRGRGRQPTWPEDLTGFFRIPIDHCLHSDGLTTIDRSLGPACGSDHRALHVELRVTGANQ